MSETNIINIGPFVVTFLITLSVAVFALRRRSVDGGGSFSLWAFILALWNLGYIFELASRTLGGKIFWDDLQTSLVALFPVAFLFFTMQYSRRKPRRMNWIWAVLLLLAAASIALIYTNPYHHLVDGDEWLIPGAPYPDLGHQYAPLTFIMLAVFILVLLAGISLLVQRLFDPHWIYRAQVATIIIGILLCLAGIILTILDHPLFFHRDNNPFTNAIASLIIAFGLFRYRLFEIVPIGRDAVFDQMEDIVLVEDTQGRVVDLNPAALKDIGKKASEIIGFPAAQVITHRAEIVKQTLEQDEFRTEFEADQGGEKKYYDLRISPIRGSDRRVRGRLVMVRDITRQKKAEEIIINSRAELEKIVGERTRELQKAYEELRKGEENYRFLVNNIASIAWTSDAKGNTVFISPNVEKVYGYTPEEIYRSGDELWFGRIHPEDVDRVKQAVQAAFAGKASFDVEYRIQRRDGKWIWLHDVGTVAQNDKGEEFAYGVFSEITRQKETEEALRQSEEKYRALFEFAPMSIVIMNLDGMVVDVNEFFKIPWEQSIGKRFMDLGFIHPEYLGLVKNMFERFKMGEEPPPAEIKLFPGPNERWVEIHPAVLKKEGKPYGLQVVSIDITGRKKLEAQLGQAQKMEAIGRLAGGIAHDFNNQLTVILMAGELLEQGFDPDDRRLRHLEVIRQAAERSAGLTRQLLAFSRKQVIQPELLDLNQSVSHLERMLGRVIGEDVKLEMFLEAKNPQVKIDPVQLEQVILNLAVNARDAMPNGGKLTIETKDVAIDANFAKSHFSIPTGDYVMLSITDTGRGIEKEVLPNIFEPFYTTKERGQGSGFGLSIVYGIVKQANGDVSVYSEPGIGTTFKVYLPRAVGEELLSPKKETPAAHELVGTEKILVVEDNTAAREIVLNILSSSGYQTVGAASGEEALEVEEKQEVKFDMLITDVVMPGMSGKELAEIVASRNPGISILFFSGYTDNIIAHHGVLEEGINFIQKPFTRVAFLKKVREVLDQD